MKNIRLLLVVFYIIFVNNCLFVQAMTENDEIPADILNEIEAEDEYGEPVSEEDPTSLKLRRVGKEEEIVEEKNDLDNWNDHLAALELPTLDWKNTAVNYAKALIDSGQKTIDEVTKEFNDIVDQKLDEETAKNVKKDFEDRIKPKETGTETERIEPEIETTEETKPTESEANKTETAVAEVKPEEGKEISEQQKEPEPYQKELTESFDILKNATKESAEKEMEKIIETTKKLPPSPSRNAELINQFKTTLDNNTLLKKEEKEILLKNFMNTLIENKLPVVQHIQPEQVIQPIVPRIQEAQPGSESVAHQQVTVPSEKQLPTEEHTKQLRTQLRQQQFIQVAAQQASPGQTTLTEYLTNLSPAKRKELEKEQRELSEFWEEKIDPLISEIQTKNKKLYDLIDKSPWETFFEQYKKKFMVTLNLLSSHWELGPNKQWQDMIKKEIIVSFDNYVNDLIMQLLKNDLLRDALAIKFIVVQLIRAKDIIIPQINKEIDDYNKKCWFHPTKNIDNAKKNIFNFATDCVDVLSTNFLPYKDKNDYFSREYAFINRLKADINSKTITQQNLNNKVIIFVLSHEYDRQKISFISYDSDIKYQNEDNFNKIARSLNILGIMYFIHIAINQEKYVIKSRNFLLSLGNVFAEEEFYTSSLIFGAYLTPEGEEYCKNLTIFIQDPLINITTSKLIERIINNGGYFEENVEKPINSISFYKKTNIIAKYIETLQESQ